MKKARKVDLEEGQVLTKPDFKKLYDHAKNSALWYVMNGNKTLHQIKEKLYDKGYPRGVVFWVNDEGVNVESDIVSEIAAFLVSNLFVDDEDYALRFAQSRKRNGFGQGRVKSDLFLRGVDEKFIQQAIGEVYGSGDVSELERYLSKEYRLMSRREANTYKLKSKLISKAVSKGWSLDDIYRGIDELFNEDLA